jgi:hypothetical protein
MTARRGDAGRQPRTRVSSARILFETTLSRTLQNVRAQHVPLRARCQLVFPERCWVYPGGGSASVPADDLVPAAHAAELVLPATSPQARKRADGASNLIALKFTPRVQIVDL